MAEPMREYVERFATLHGWKPEEGEGALEFCFRMHYRQGKEDATPQAAGGEPVAWQAKHVKENEWRDVSEAAFNDLKGHAHWWVRALYAHPAPAIGQEWVEAWISDNDLLKLRSSVDEARNIRMASKRNHLRVHKIYIPALAAAPAQPAGGGAE